MQQKVSDEEMAWIAVSLDDSVVIINDLISDFSFLLLVLIDEISRLRC